MSRVPALTPRKLVAALKKAGYYETGQSGSHLMLEHKSRKKVIVPIHARDLGRSLMKTIIKQTGLTEAEFSALL